MEIYEKVKIKDIIVNLGIQKKIKRSDYLKEGTYPIIDQGKDFIAGYTEDIELLYNGPLPVILFGDHTLVIRIINFPFARGADGTQLLRPNDVFDIWYFYYSLKNLPLESHGYERHFKYLKEKEIPRPPMDIQKKIAEYLKPIDETIINNKIKNLKLLKISDIYLHLIFNGEISLGQE